MVISAFHSHLAFGCLLLACHTAAAQTYTYTVITPPGSVETIPAGLSKSGVVLGEWYDSGGSPHGFTYFNGTYTTIDFPNAIYTQPSGIDERGEIVGSYTNAQHVVHAFLYKNGTFEEVNAPGANVTELAGINRRGVALGYSSAGLGSAFTFKGNVFKTINTHQYVAPVAINNSGAVTGNYFPPAPMNITAWLYDKGNIVVLPVSSDQVQAVALNGKNEVVGTQLLSSAFDGFLYSNGKVKSIIVPHSTGTYPEGISENGDITGYYTDANYNEFGFVLSKGKFVSLSAPNAAGTFGLTMNVAGQVLGGYHDANRNQYVFLATPAN